MANRLLGKTDMPRIVATRVLWEEGTDEPAASLFLPSLATNRILLPTPLPHEWKGSAMLTWVVYDISKDRTRTKIADRCLDFGLQRVQKSVFLGDIPPNRVEEIIQFSKELFNLETDAVYVFPMCRDDFDKVRIVGQGFDKKMVADEVLTTVI